MLTCLHCESQTDKTMAECSFHEEILNLKKSATFIKKIWWGFGKCVDLAKEWTEHAA